MQFAELPTALQAIALVVGAFVAWTVLRLALRFTVRIFTLGCLAIAVVVVVGGIVGWIG
jgi:hypothetical protein